MDGKVVCPECGDSFKKIGNHWQHNSHRPNLTDKQYEVSVGLLMGDGCLGRNSQNPFLKVAMITRDYLEYLDDLFGIHGTGVKHKWTPEEAAEQIVDRGFHCEANPKDYHNVYTWNTRVHPDFSELNWYTSNGKTWPEDITLTPTVLKHWYVSDGSWNNKGPRNRLSIAASNEVGNEDKIRSMFSRSGLPEPSNFRVQERQDGSKKMDMRFTSSDTDTLLDYMGQSLPGFSYKFPQ
jgi:hypothetical protein